MGGPLQGPAPPCGQAQQWLLTGLEGHPGHSPSLPQSRTLLLAPLHLPGCSSQSFLAPPRAPGSILGPSRLLPPRTAQGVRLSHITHPAPRCLSSNRIPRSLHGCPKGTASKPGQNGSRKPAFVLLHNFRKCRDHPPSGTDRNSRRCVESCPPYALPPTRLSTQQVLCSPTSRRWGPRWEASGNPRDCGERLS